MFDFLPGMMAFETTSLNEKGSFVSSEISKGISLTLLSIDEIFFSFFDSIKSVISLIVVSENSKSTGTSTFNFSLHE